MKKIIVSIVLIIGAILGVCFGLNLRVLAAELDEVSPYDLYIKAVNPGYTVDGQSNVGELIEIARENSDQPLSLAGVTVSYTNTSGNRSVIFQFPENSWMVGEALLLRLASSPGAELAAANYTKTLAFKAGIGLEFNGESVTELCWTGKDGCLTEFKSSHPTTLVRNAETGEYEHLSEYEPLYEPSSYRVDEDTDKGQVVASQCTGMEFSEILSYYETSKSEQFVEFHNNTAGQIVLDGCKLKYKNKLYELSGIVQADEYKVYNPNGFTLTKNPTNSNLVELIDADGSVVDSLSYPNGQRKGTSYALIGYDGSGNELWHVTYAPTPGAPNNYQEFKSCEEGKVLNKETGNCVKATSVIAKVCKEGQYLNILTGRCRKIEETKEKTCKEGYYLNPETNRCRKIAENKGADYSLTPESYEEESSFVALYAVLGVLGVGVVYLIYEFRLEILKLWRKVFRRSR